MQPSRRHLLLGAALLGACASTRANAHANTGAIADVAQSLYENSNVPALSAAVCGEHGPIWSGAFGKADLELNVEATPAHAFRLGSVSKVITASLAARLEQEGRVNLNAPIATYLADLPEQHRATTLLQLLTHRGGVRHYNAGDFDFSQAGGLPDFRPYSSNAEILALFVNDPLIAAPGAAVSYSTFGYTLASIILESAAGRPFVDLIREEIATPLGLASLHADNPFVVTPNRVRFYSPPDEVQPLTPATINTVGNAPASNPAYKVAGGGMIMSAADLARFGAAHLAAGHWSQNALDRLFTLQTEATPRLPPMGLGWRIDADESGRLRWHHAGTQQGCRAALIIYPRERIAIAFATNLTATPGDVLTPAARFADTALA